jgi:plastocyanin
LAVATVAIFVAVAAVAFSYVGTNSTVTSLQGQVSTLQSEMQTIGGSVPGIDQPPQTRNITLEWGMLISTQDRFFPQVITVNQGDTINLLFEVNDTDGGHTFSIDAPTGPSGALQLTQLNSSWPGQWLYFPPRQAGPQFGTEVTGAPTGCMTMGQSVPCNTVGGCSINGGAYTNCIGSWMLKSNQTEIASLHASVTFGPLRAPGVYRYFCNYHQDIGMIGYLVVLPNKGYSS